VVYGAWRVPLSSVISWPSPCLLVFKLHRGSGRLFFSLWRGCNLVPSFLCARVCGGGGSGAVLRAVLARLVYYFFIYLNEMTHNSLA
jgi:hypothetical protein